MFSLFPLFFFRFLNNVRQFISSNDSPEEPPTAGFILVTVSVGAAAPCTISVFLLIFVIFLRALPNLVQPEPLSAPVYFQLDHNLPYG